MIIGAYTNVRRFILYIINASQISSTARLVCRKKQYIITLVGKILPPYTLKIMDVLPVPR
jgi:hypothetical protein